MTSLSIRSSNAIKSSPGKGQSEVDCGIDEIDSSPIGNKKPAARLLSKGHIEQLVTSIRSPEIILVFVLSLCIFFGLLSLRYFDDNRLTSWHWLFVNADMLLVTACLVGGLLAAVLFINRTVPHYQALFSLILLSILISMTHWGNPEVIVDAGRYFSQAKYLEVYGLASFFDQWGKGVFAWTDLPLVPLIYGLIFKLFGESRTAVQIINTFFFSGTVFLVYCLGRQLWDNRVGLYGASLLLAIPYLHTQSALMMVDVPAMFFLTLAIYLYTRAITSDRQIIAVLSAAGILMAMLSKYTNWVMLSALPVISYVYWLNASASQDRTMVIKRSRNVLLIFSLMFIIPLGWGHKIFLHQADLLVNYQLAILNGWTESHLSTFFYQVHPAITIFAIISIYVAYRQRDSRLMIVSWMVLLMLLMDMERIRYVLIVFPMLALMAGYALSRVNRVDVRRYLVLSVLVTACTVSVFGHASFLKENSAANLQHAANYLDKLDYTSAEVILLGQGQSSVNPLMSLPLLDLYTHKEVKLSGLNRLENNALTNVQKRSTLRFTWEYELPGYYNLTTDNEQEVVVIVLSDKSQALPVAVKERLSGYYRDRRFEQDEGIFRYKTIVDIYLPAGNGK